MDLSEEFRTGNSDHTSCLFISVQERRERVGENVPFGWEKESSGLEAY
jgi:hypothetical protein